MRNVKLKYVRMSLDITMLMCRCYTQNEKVNNQFIAWYEYFYVLTIGVMAEDDSVRSLMNCVNVARYNHVYGASNPE
jgi:hypothetical protein